MALLSNFPEIETKLKCSVSGNKGNSSTGREAKEKYEFPPLISNH